MLTLDGHDVITRAGLCKTQQQHEIRGPRCGWTPGREPSGAGTAGAEANFWRRVGERKGNAGVSWYLEILSRRAQACAERGISRYLEVRDASDGPISRAHGV